MKRFFFSTLFALGFLILSACQQNGEQVNTVTPTEAITASPTKTETITPSPTLANTKTPTPVPIPIVDYSQTIPPTLAPGRLQGKVIFNRNYNGYFHSDNDEQDATTILDLESLNKIYLTSSQKLEDYFPQRGEYKLLSYSWGSGIAINTSYHPSFANYVWSNDGSKVAFPCLTLTDTRICTSNTTSLQQGSFIVDSIAESFVIVPEIYVPTESGGYFDARAGDGRVDSITWSPNDKNLLIVAYSRIEEKIKTPCLINQATKEVKCGAENIFLGFTHEEYQLLSLARNYSWSPVDETKLAFFLEYETEEFTPGIYLLDTKTKKVSLLKKRPQGFRFSLDQKIIWDKNGNMLTFTFHNITQDSVFGTRYATTLASIQTNGENFSKLLDSTDVYKQIAGNIPEEYRDNLPLIYVSSWLPDEKHLLLEIKWRNPKNWQDYLLGIFLYDIETGQIIEVKSFELISVGTAFSAHRLFPSYAP